MRKSTKKVAAVGVAAVTLASAGVAYAYWTSEGSGTGTATIGTTSRNVILHGTSTNTSATLDSNGVQTAAAVNQLYPGGPAATVALTADNPNSYSVSLNKLQVKLASVNCAGDTDANGNPVDRKSWFTLDPTTTVTAAQGTTPAPAGANDIINSTTQLAPHSSSSTVVQTSPSVAIAMLDSSDNQNVCKGVAISYTFNLDPQAASSGVNYNTLP